jgi:excinuclease ABC subunit B
VQLLREGLDLPEVSLVAILDADKEGFLRAERSLIQTIGRAARHVEGVALLYADNLTDSMQKAISETERRRAIQQAYNTRHGITPMPAGKRAGNAILAFLELSRRLNDEQPDQAVDDRAVHEDVPLDALPELIIQLEERMKAAAKNLEFEQAADLRDRIRQLRQKLVGRS